MICGQADLEAKKFLTIVSESVDRLAIFWDLVMASTDFFISQSARAFGFGVATSSVLSQPARAKAPLKKFKSGDHAPPAQYSTQGLKGANLTPLMEQELFEKKKWIVRPEKIALEAGSSPSSTTTIRTMSCLQLRGSSSRNLFLLEGLSGQSPFTFDILNDLLNGSRREVSPSIRSLLT